MNIISINKLIATLKDLKEDGYKTLSLDEFLQIFTDEFKLDFTNRKQIPQKPIYDCYKHLYICPNCGKFLQTYNEHQKYSMCCGQLLDWDL